MKTFISIHPAIELFLCRKARQLHVLMLFWTSCSKMCFNYILHIFLNNYYAVFLIVRGYFRNAAAFKLVSTFSLHILTDLWLFVWILTVIVLLPEVFF